MNTTNIFEYLNADVNKEANKKYVPPAKRYAKRNAIVKKLDVNDLSQFPVFGQKKENGKIDLQFNVALECEPEQIDNKLGNGWVVLPESDRPESPESPLHYHHRARQVFNKMVQKYEADKQRYRDLHDGEDEFHHSPIYSSSDECESSNGSDYDDHYQGKYGLSGVYKHNLYL